VFYLLKEGCPLMDYEYLKDLFSFLKSKTCPKNLGLKANWIGHSYDILGARMLWKPKEARILKNLKKNYRSTSVIW
jgi:hypothetical protein